MGRDNFDVVIIGGGLGGLLCGAILSKNGYRVCVLEKHHQIGGNLQTFKRDGIEFNSSMHFVGTMERGQILYKFFKYLGILDKIGLEKMDRSCYEKIYLCDKVYELPTGVKEYREKLLAYFPGEKEAIDAYLKKFQDVWNSSNILKIKSLTESGPEESGYTHTNVYDFIESLTANEDLKAIWGVTSSLYAGIPGQSSLNTHAVIGYHNILGAYRFNKGSNKMANALKGIILNHGGTVRTNSEVVNFRFRDQEICAVELKNGSPVSGKSFISSIHPALLVKMVEPGRFRKAYVNRILELENTIGAFCVYIKTRKSAFRDINSSVFISNTRSVWNAGVYDQLPWPSCCLLFTTSDRNDSEFAESVNLYAFMKFREVIQWEHTTVEKRGEEYRRFKQQKAEELIDLVESRFPGFRSSIDSYYAATPLTYRDYTGIPEGSMYGILKDCNNPKKSYISAITRIPNLFLSGQNAGGGMHGVLGVTVSALFTCAQFMPVEDLLKKIRDE